MAAAMAELASTDTHSTEEGRCHRAGGLATTGLQISGIIARGRGGGVGARIQGSGFRRRLARIAGITRLPSVMIRLSSAALLVWLS